MSQSFLDSVAVFTEAANRYGLGDVCLQGLKNRGWHTYAGLAFSTAFSPDEKNDGEYFAESVIKPLREEESLEEDQVPMLRRLWKESQVYWTAHMKKKVESEDRPTKLAPAELAERLTRIRAKLAGLALDGSLEPSHALINKFAQMFEENTLRHIPWEALTSRTHEAQGLSRDSTTKTVAADAMGFLKVSSSDTSLTVPLGSDLRIEQALIRRGVAMDMSGLLDFHKHKLLVARFTEDLTRDPIEGYSRISWAQVLRADQEFFRLMSDKTLGKLQHGPDGQFACDAVFDEVMVSPEFVRHLLPLPALHSKAPQGIKREQPSDQSSAKRSKGKGKSKDRGLPIPQELREKGAVLARSPTGDRLCFSYNLGRCNVEGSSCPRGQHACMKCGRMGHPLTKCQ
eukprot:5192359-Amphidinium_carterae.1